MKKKIFMFMLLLVGICLPILAQVSNDNKDGVYKVAENAPKYVANEVIVKFKDDSGITVRRNARGRFASSARTTVDKLLASFGTEELEQLMPESGKKTTMHKAKALNGDFVEDKDLSQLYVARFDSTKTSVDDAIKALQELDEVEYAEPNYIVYICAAEDGTEDNADPSTYNDPMRSQQWGIDAINLPKLWALGKTDNKRPIIAILDTGCDITHPDLAANIWENSAEANGEEYADDDNNNYFDDIHGYNFVDMNTDLTDNCGHGTHCAGIAAAVGNNGIGITGANPDAYIMPVKVLSDNGTGAVSNIIKGIDYAIANGADVLNMSFGFGSKTDALEDAVMRAYANSVIVVAAAGNDGRNWHAQILPIEIYPAGYNTVIGVMACDSYGKKSSFSNYDDQGRMEWPNEHFEVIAPGNNIISTFPGGLYKSLSGTSMATPLVAGAYSRILQYRGFDYARDYGTNDDFYFASHKKDEAGTYSTLKAFDAYQMSQYTDDNRETNIRISAETIPTDEDNDGTVDAGETVLVYPVLSSTRGKISETKFTIKPIAPHTVDEIYEGMLEDDIYSIMLDKTMSPEFYDIDQTDVDFGWQINTSENLKGKNPFTIKLHDDAPHDRYVVCMIYGESRIAKDSTMVYFKVDNISELSGVINNDTILPGKKIVAKNCAILPGVTVTLSEGTDLSGDIQNYGIIVAGSGSTIRGLWNVQKYDSNTSKYVYHGKTILNSGSKLYTENVSSLEEMWFTAEIPDYLSDEYGEGSYSQDCVNVADSILQINAGAQLYLTKNMLFHGDCTINGDSNNPIYIYSCVNDNFAFPVFRLDKNQPSWSNVKIIGDVVFESIKYMCCEDCYQSNNAFFKVKSFDITGKIYSVDYSGGYLANDVQTTDKDGNLITNCCCCYCGKVLGRHGYQHNGGYIKYSSLEFSDMRLNCPYTLGYIGNIFRHCNVMYEKSSNHKFYYYEQIYNYETSQDENVISTYFSQPSHFDKFINCNEPITSIDLSLYYDVLETPPSEILVPYYCGSSSLDFINKHVKTSVWWPNVKYTGFAEGADRPSPDNPGTVWTVKVNGKDAYDEYDESLPVGLGDLNIDVWFNRPMDKSVIPTVTMGISSPYNKITASDGEWNEEGTIYKTKFTLDAKSSTNGVNTILVKGAKDLDGIEILEETNFHRFKVNVQSADALSTDLVADAGVGKVTLDWNTDEADFVDLMGYNVYRFTDASADTIKVNSALIDPKESEFVDYNVTPGTTYYYLVREIGTDFQEFDVSNIVSATPVNAEKGDANGSMTVDVADVMTEVYYLTGDNPQPFLFDAADVNSDKNINVLDVIGTVNIIKKGATAESIDEQDIALYSVQNGVLYVETPCALSGVQVQLFGDKNSENITVAENMNGFENVNEWLNDQTYFFLGYSLSGHVLAPGKHALLNIGSTELSGLVLSDTHGHNVMAVSGEASNISNVTNLEGCTFRFTDLAGCACNANSLKPGMYIVTAIKDGKAVKSFKLMKK